MVMPDLPNIETFSPVEKIALINEYRSRLLAGEEVTDDELALAVRMLRDLRTDAAVSRKQKPKDIVPTELSNF